MTGSSKRKGDAAELEAASLLTHLLGRTVKRLLGAGRAEDVGDLTGIAGWVVQVAWWPKATLAAIRSKPLDAEVQAGHSGVPHAVAMIRLVGGTYRMVMTPEQWARIVTELEEWQRTVEELQTWRGTGIASSAAGTRRSGPRAGAVSATDEHEWRQGTLPL
jgi:hypothetical protein